MPLEDYAEAAIAAGTLAADPPDDWRHVPGEPWRIVEGQPYVLYPRLTARESGAPVAWRDGVYEPRWEGGFATKMTVVSTSAVEVTPGHRSRATIRVVTGGASFDFARIQGVPLSAATSLEIVVLSLLDAEDPTISLPYAARAIVRDADGHLLFGAPVTWETGPMRLAVSTESYGTIPPEYTLLTDACRDPATVYGPQTATLTARVGDLVAEVPLSWTPRHEPEIDEDWAPDASCSEPTPEPETSSTADTGCASTGSTPVGIAMSLVSAALLARRRRSASSAAPHPSSVTTASAAPTIAPPRTAPSQTPSM